MLSLEVEAFAAKLRIYEIEWNATPRFDSVQMGLDTVETSRPREETARPEVPRSQEHAVKLRAIVGTGFLAMGFSVGSVFSIFWLMPKVRLVVL
jgi:hypothetical protein